ncbi:hypothetical protein ACPA9J_08770 [Pseudomonas aeruginosa]
MEINTDDANSRELLSRACSDSGTNSATEVALARASRSTAYDADQLSDDVLLFVPETGLVANKDQLFYRQNEQFQPQAIRDTLPILLGVSSSDRYELNPSCAWSNGI